MPSYAPLDVRIERWSMPEPNSGCWLWLGSIDDCGYGKMRGGRDDPGESLAHRVSFKFHVGPIPDGLELDHKCRTRCCVNPYHLRAVTHAVNVAESDRTTNHRNRIKTHCLRGHEFSPENTVIEKWNGITMRKCRVCRLMRQRRRYAAKALKASAA